MHLEPVLSDWAPQHCPECNAPAYVGLNFIECTNPGCHFYSKETAIRHWAETIEDVLGQVQEADEAQWDLEEGD